MEDVPHGAAIERVLGQRRRAIAQEARHRLLVLRRLPEIETRKPGEPMPDLLEDRPIQPEFFARTGDGRWVDC